MDKLNQAFATLKAGLSYQEASDITGIAVDTIMQEWLLKLSTPRKVTNADTGAVQRTV